MKETKFNSKNILFLNIKNYNYEENDNIYFKIKSFEWNIIKY